MNKKIEINKTTKSLESVRLYDLKQNKINKKQDIYKSVHY